MKLTDLQLDTIRYIRWRRARYGTVYPADLARHYGVALPVMIRRLNRIATHGIIARNSGRFKPITILKKHCPQCRQWLNETPENFSRTRISSGDGWCIVCKREATRAWRKRNLDHIHAYRAATLDTRMEQDRIRKARRKAKKAAEIAARFKAR